MKFSANTGFLWKDRPFPERIRAAFDHGFDCVEFHDEAQAHDLHAIKAVLAECMMPVCGLNVRMGETAGCAAIPGMETEAANDFLDALRVADTLDVPAIHVLCGKTNAPGAQQTFITNLQAFSARTGRLLLIEPISGKAMPGYFLNTLTQASAIIDAVGAPNVRVMFDAFHVAAEEGPQHVASAFAQFRHIVGHVQIAGYPDRGTPEEGEIDMRTFLETVHALRPDLVVGLEFRQKDSADVASALRNSFKR